MSAMEAWLDAERDQLALWLPVGLGLGIALWFLLPTRDGWTIAMLAAAGVGGLAFALGRGGRLGPAIGLFAVATALGCGIVWWRAERVAAPILPRVTVATFEGQVEAVEPRPADGITRLTLAPTGDLPPRIRVNVADRDLPAGIVAGTRVSLRARLLPPPTASLPGAYDFARVAWFKGLGATGRALGRVTITAPSPERWRDRLAAWRQRLTAHIVARVGGAAGGIAAAFVTGDVGAIRQQDGEAMRRSGLAHLLSISGLHVTAAVGAAMLLALRLLALSPTLALRWPLPVIAAGAGALVGIGYTLLSGAEVPTIRSCVAALLVLGGIVMGREAITLRLVATGALIVLLLWPEALAGPSFQLSFAAVTAIVALHEHPRIRALFLKRDEGLAPRLTRELGSLLLTGIVVEGALMPIGLYHFHRAGLYGAMANILAIPLSTFVIMPLEALALLFDVAGLGASLWWLAGHAVRLLLAIAHVTASLPGSSAALPSMPAGAFALMIAGGLWIALWRTRLRRLGLVPLVAGALWTIATPAPDILITGDGRHVAVRTSDGRLVLLRDRAGDYVRDMMGTAAGVEGEADPLDGAPEARCNADLCRINLAAGGRTWRLLATRSVYFVDRAAFAGACATADIVVSDRRLPRTCTPRWIRADRDLLRATGGLAITLATGRVDSVVMPGDEHPWR
ncbi:ComEC/Rec2 family competence protein [Sphingomonas naphthae]|uniref:ComEC/Rec2 family competence protein n=1 Tax=Sphingomonas naphthae TaxID=1813468 RepID=A0ABY7TQ24_9SPHN|nr:ComEC/Rec2 family competence protein [Sphingomonas naphthae]WCT75337.1 ComEC/Rec2 family competence protein [Sphingomonas naphthae]